MFYQQNEAMKQGTTEAFEAKETQQRSLIKLKATFEKKCPKILHKMVMLLPLPLIINQVHAIINPQSACILQTKTDEFS